MEGTQRPQGEESVVAASASPADEQPVRVAVMVRPMVAQEMVGKYHFPLLLPYRQTAISLLYSPTAFPLSQTVVRSASS